jgi:hypothetical protein
MSKINFYTAFGNTFGTARCAKTLDGIKEAIRDQFENVWGATVSNVEIGPKTLWAGVHLSKAVRGDDPAKLFHNVVISRRTLTFED